MRATCLVLGETGRDRFQRPQRTSGATCRGSRETPPRADAARPNQSRPVRRSCLSVAALLQVVTLFCGIGVECRQESPSSRQTSPSWGVPVHGIEGSAKTPCVFLLDVYWSWFLLAYYNEF